jgi:hypothetical protein
MPNTETQSIGIREGEGWEGVAHGMRSSEFATVL